MIYLKNNLHWFCKKNVLVFFVKEIGCLFNWVNINGEDWKTWFVTGNKVVEINNLGLKSKI